MSGALLFLAPFLCYLYLPIRAAAHPPVNWTNPVTLDRFLTHALGRQYTHFALNNYSRPEVLAAQAGKLLGESLAASPALSVILALIGLPLIAWGLVALCRSRRQAAVSLAAGAAALAFWVLGWGETTDLKVFLGPLGAVLALCGGWGLARLEMSPPVHANGRLLAGGMGMVIAVLLLVGNWERADQSNLWQHRDRWVAVLWQMDKNAIFVSDFDVPSFATIYLQNVEGLRKDVTLLRTVGMMQPWYVELVQDEELRRTADQSWKETSAELGLTGSGTPQFWQGTALFAWRLAQHYRGRRPVYALHGPMGADIPGPPYPIGLSEDLVKLDFTRPDLLRTDEGKLIATFPDGVELVSFALDRNRVYAGETVRFTARWRCNQPVPAAHFAVWLVPQRGVHGQVPDPWVRPRQSKGRFEQGFPLLYGQAGLPPSSPGTVYEQRGTLIIPTDLTRAAGGRMYTAWIGFSSTYPPQYAGWTETQVLHLEKRAAPANPP